VSRPLVPPPTLRATLDAHERRLIQAVVGPADDQLIRPLRDARGREFQRLEFLGDSVLDLVLAVHACVEPSCAACRRVDGHVTRLVTDVQLGRQARSHGLGEWLEWQASDERLADLVEACVAVAFLAGSWSRAVACIDPVVHPLGPETMRTLDGGWAGTGARTPVRGIGSALLELAAAQAVFERHPDADEGELSGRRAALHQTSRVAHRARQRRLVDGHGADAAVSDRVEVLLAERLLSAGADAAGQDAVAVLVDERQRRDQ
jgi:dsRNA-specific ribonuclease